MVNYLVELLPIQSNTNAIVCAAKQAKNIQIVFVLPNRILMYCSIDKQSTCKFSNSAFYQIKS